MKNFFYTLFWGLIAIITLGRVKNSVANSKSPTAILAQFYNAGGILAVVLGLGPVTASIILALNNQIELSALFFCLIPFGLLLIPDNKQP